MLSSVLLGVRCLICSVVTGNAWVVCMPFRGGPVRANLLVRVDCQAYQPTHFTIWLYSYCRSGTLTVSAHQNTTLTPTAPSERNLHYKSVQVIKNWSFTPHIYNPRYLKTTTWVLVRHMPNTHFNFLFFMWKNRQLFHALWYSYSTDFRKTASRMFRRRSTLKWFTSYAAEFKIKSLKRLWCLQKLYH